MPDLEWHPYMRMKAAMPYTLFTYRISKDWNTKTPVLARTGFLRHSDTSLAQAINEAFFRLQRVPKIKLESKEKNMYFPKGSLWLTADTQVSLGCCLTLAETGRVSVIPPNSPHFLATRWPGRAQPKTGQWASLPGTGIWEPDSGGLSSQELERRKLNSHRELHLKKSRVPGIFSSCLAHKRHLDSVNRLSLWVFQIYTLGLFSAYVLVFPKLRFQLVYLTTILTSCLRAWWAMFLKQTESGAARFNKSPNSPSASEYYSDRIIGFLINFLRFFFFKSYNNFKINESWK